jgi:predicted nucleotidyltransferase
VAEAWVKAALAERARAREALIGKARAFVEEVARSGDLVAAVVYGSVARGDFNVWSDVDLLLVLERLPEKAHERLARFSDRVPAGVQVVAWTPDELADALRAKNPIACEAVTAGVVLHGSDTVDALRPRDGTAGEAAGSRT